jgi:anti-sigma factor RsiW
MSMREAFHIPEEDLIQYALGTLKDSQMSQFTAHISLCNECRSQLANFQVELASFAAVQPLEELPAGARDRFLARSVLMPRRNRSSCRCAIRARPSMPCVPSSNGWSRRCRSGYVSGALAAALIYVGYDDLSHIHQIRQMQPEMARFERQAAELTDLQDFLHGTNTQQVSLHDRPASQQSSGGACRLFAASSGKLVFTASNLPQPPAGKAYELWVLPISGAAPVQPGSSSRICKGTPRSSSPGFRRMFRQADLASRWKMKLEPRSPPCQS